MKYRCKLVIKNHLHDGMMSSFKMILKYKKEGKLFYDDLELISSFCCLHSNYAKEKLLPQLKILSDMSEVEFMNFIKEALIKKLGIEVQDNKDYEQLEESIKILKDRSKEFFIEI